MNYMPWPYAVESFNWYAPEVVLQVPLDVFKRMVEEAEEENLPEWYQSAIDSGALHVLLPARSFVSMLGNVDEVPEWMLLYAEAEYLEDLDRKEELCGSVS